VAIIRADVAVGTKHPILVALHANEGV